MIFLSVAMEAFPHIVAALDVGVTDAGAVVAQGGLSERVIEIFLLVTTLSLAPGLAMMATSLPLMVIVFSILRQGGGLQQAPPNMMIMGVAMFLTWYVMEPIFNSAWVAGVSPYLTGMITENQAVAKIIAPFAEFMLSRVDSSAIEALSDARGAQAPLQSGSVPLSILAPAFVLSEIQRAFQIGFVILMPFLIIDLLIASILMAMGMMMVPPAIVSLPFKLAFFVLTNGWIEISAALVRSYS